MDKTMDLFDKICMAQTQLERAETILNTVTIDYFDRTENDPKTPEGRDNIWIAFNRNKIFAEIASDYLAVLQAMLSDAEDMAKGLVQKAE